MSESSEIEGTVLSDFQISGGGMFGEVEMRDNSSTSPLRLHVDLREVYAVYRSATYFGMGIKLRLTGIVKPLGLCCPANLVSFIFAGEMQSITVDRWRDIKIVEIASSLSTADTGSSSLERCIANNQPFATVAQLTAADSHKLPYHCKPLST